MISGISSTLAALSGKKRDRMLRKRSLKPRRPVKSFERFIASVERIGNLLPHPFFLFIVLIFVQMT